MSAADATDNGNPFSEQLPRRPAARVIDMKIAIFIHGGSL